MARLSLPLLFLTLLASTTLPANEISPPAPLDHWQESDWKGVPDSTRIDKQRVLFAKHDGDSYFHSFGLSGKDHWSAGFQHFWLNARATLRRSA